jgi:thioredoxin 1
MKSLKFGISMHILMIFTTFVLIAFSCNTNSNAKVENKEVDNIKTLSSSADLTTAMQKNSSKLMVIDLYADWCGPCKLLSPVLQNLSKDYNDSSVIFYKVNVDNSPEIASMFGVQGIPFVAFIKNKEPFYGLTGLYPKETYQNVISKCSSAESAEACQQLLQQ